MLIALLSPRRIEFDRYRDTEQTVQLESVTKTNEEPVPLAVHLAGSSCGSKAIGTSGFLTMDKLSSKSALNTSPMPPGSSSSRRASLLPVPVQIESGSESEAVALQ